jgi:hypothetical protein
VSVLCDDGVCDFDVGGNFHDDHGAGAVAGDLPIFSERSLLQCFTSFLVYACLHSLWLCILSQRLFGIGIW